MRRQPQKPDALSPNHASCEIGGLPLHRHFEIASHQRSHKPDAAALLALLVLVRGRHAPLARPPPRRRTSAMPNGSALAGASSNDGSQPPSPPPRKAGPQ